MTHAQITITRGDAEMLVSVSGNVLPEDVEDLSAEGLQGGVVYLDSDEQDTAIDALMAAARQERESRLVDAKIDEIRDEP